MTANNNVLGAAASTRSGNPSGIQPNGDVANSVYDPELMGRISVNGTSGRYLATTVDDLEEHLHHDLAVMEVTNRLRQKRRLAIRRYTAVFVAVAFLLMVGIGITSRTIEKEKKVNRIAEQHLGNSGVTVLPQPPASLASKCKISALKTPTGTQECESACEVAECCIVPAGFALSCQLGNEVTCPKYRQYCNILDWNSPITSNDKTTDIVPAGSSEPPAMAPVLQPPIPVPTQAPQPLVQPPAQSPTTTITSGGDNTKYPAENASGTSTLKKQISDACEDNGFEPIALPGQLSVCEQFCQNSQCCFNHYCVPPVGIDCLDYSPCYILYNEEDPGNTDNAIPDATSAKSADSNSTTNTNQTNGLALQIQQACDSHAVEPTRSLCPTLCALGACCFEPQLACSAVNCDLYAACHDALYSDYVDGISSSGGNSAIPGTYTTEGEVLDACNNHSNSYGESSSLCVQICQEGACCFQRNSLSAQCSDAFCRTYSACQVVFGIVTP
jgi:hypothetical protein